MNRIAMALVFLGGVAACGPAKKKDPAPAGPTTANAAAYTRLTIAGDPSPSGFFDPYLAFDGTTGWLAYSGVAYHNSAGNLVQDVQTNVAKSTDAGATWTFAQPVATPENGFRVTAPDTSLCGAAQCFGHLISEVPFLLHDATDPDPAKRWKMFAHRYFLYPAGQASGKSLQYLLGAIFLQTAASPDGVWTAGTPVLGWNATPPELTAPQNVQTMTPTANCIAMSEGAGLALPGELDVAFTCIYLSGSNYVQKIVLFRSTDHAATFTAVGDLLGTTDAASIGGVMPTAPGLAMRGTTPMLLVTPISASGPYAGCATVDIADLATAAIDRVGGEPNWRVIYPTQGGAFGGACTYSDGATATQTLTIQLDVAGSPADPFRVYATHAAP